MLTTPTTTINQYGSETDDVFIHETSSQSPSDGFFGLPPPPPPPPPVPPIFNNNNMTNNCKILLPHQEVNLVVNRANITEIQARSIPSMFISNSNIWTRCVLSNLRIKQALFDQHFGDSKSPMTGRYRRASVSTSSPGGGGINGINDDRPLSFVLLDTTSKMLYDVPMRHLLQLVKKDYDDDASIDHVIRAIDQTHMKSEWLDAVTALNKQFDKRPEDKARVLAHKGSTHGLVLIEQFFVKLVRVPAYEFKLIYLKFIEEAPTQLERMNKHINDLLETIEIILNNEQLPGILQLLCLLYNSITNKTIPGLHFDSILSVLSTRTLKQNTTIAHLLCHLLEEQYPNLLNIFDNQILLKLKDLSLIKYIPIYIDIRLLYTRYKQLNHFEEEEFIFLPEHIKTTLNNLQILFTKLFDNENEVKKGEKDLSTYFCVDDLSLEICLSNLGQFIDKLRLAHMQNLEQRRRNQFLTKQTSTSSFRNTHNPYCSNTNSFRDHLNVPLTPITGRQRYKMNRILRDRYTSSRDILHDEQQEQITQNLLPNSIPRKREHSPTAKTVLTKRPFNLLGTCKLQDETKDVCIPIRSNNECEDIKMDCSINESAIVPTINALSVCENQPSFYLRTPIRNLFDCSNDQSIPINNFSTKIDEYQQLNYSDNTEKENNSTELPNSIKSIHNSTNEHKTNISMTRISSGENLRSISTNNILRRNIQRCAVSRRISTEKKDAEEIDTISSTSTKQSNISSVTRPLRAFHMSTMDLTESLSSPKSTKKSSSTSRHSHLTIKKTFASRTILTTVLPSSTLIKNQKNN